MLEKLYQKALNDINSMNGSLRNKNGYNCLVYNCDNFKKQIPIHRYIASVVFRKNINSAEEVHHLDKDSANNHYTNLMILDSRQHHIVHHFCDNHPEYYGMSQCETKKIIEYADEFIDYLNGDIIHDLDVYKARLKKRRKTGDFGKLKEMEILLKKIRNKRRVDSGKKFGSLSRTGGRKPPKETLIKILEKHMNMEKASYELGVTSNAIRKWCKSYNIDYKKYGAYCKAKITVKCPVCGKEFTYNIKHPRKYCSARCCERRVSNHIDEMEACALYCVMGMNFSQLGRLYQVDCEVIGRLIKKNLPKWDSLSNESKDKILNIIK